jgi:hypothetical protein
VTYERRGQLVRSPHFADKRTRPGSPTTLLPLGSVRGLDEYPLNSPYGLPVVASVSHLATAFAA